MLGVKVSLKEAESMKEYLIKNNLMNFDYIPIRQQQHIIFPITKHFGDKHEISTFDFVEKPIKKNWREEIEEQLTDSEKEILVTAHDVVGNIAIIEIPDELVKREKLIGEILIKHHQNIHTVAKKDGQHEGIFRTQQLKVIAGENTLETIHKENNISLKLNVQDIYFSSRLSTERKRIYKQIRKGEEVLVMFSGCAPYPCVISKNTQAKKIVGIELNPAAHEYALFNITLNKLKNVELINGDVKKKVPKLNEQFDRILMPLPKTADEFLETALKVAKTGTIFHLYDFLHETEFEQTEQKAKEICQKNGFDLEVLEFVKCGQYSPGKFRVCLDFKIIRAP